MSTITVIGAGLVGATIAAILAEKGHIVQVVEQRPDTRKMQRPEGRSINLAISERGWSTLQYLQLAEQAHKVAVPMYGRMVHNLDGSTVFHPYGLNEQCIYSVSREHLNTILLTHAESCNKVRIHFEHKCLHVNTARAEVQLMDMRRKKELTMHADVLFGADGLHSKTRESAGFDYQFNYINYGYKELVLSGNLNLDKNALHIWPRGNFMLIALPNSDASFTFTLFLPFTGPHSFATINNRQQAFDFCKNFLPDLLDRAPGIADALSLNREYKLCAVSCDTWYKNNLLLLGDAAHGILPFYGQGANMGLEDCLVLKDIMEQTHSGWQDVFKKFHLRRKPDANAIAMLSLQNFIEMRDKVTDPVFQCRRKIEAYIAKKFPDHWTPLYTMIAFTRIPYAEAFRIAREQDAILDEIMKVVDIDTIWENIDSFINLNKTIYMNVPDIKKVKQKLEDLKNEQLLQNWELPYENILSRLTAAIFFITPADNVSMEQIATAFLEYENFSWRHNTEQKLSQLVYRVTFSKEEKDKNLQPDQAANSNVDL